ncbi:phage major tail tube protein [Fusobacterium ulcerans]|uniref:phage major tail tube protein n=1 Tax=Fusobacterium ulcerans TaxID=861 RepID=UPI0027BA4C70|nr:phage major tail tube protein [Fusobacterium ulcerans]
MAVIPVVINNAIVRKNGDNILQGIASVTLPKLSKKSESLEAFGVAGTVDVPVESHYEAMTTNLKFVNMTQDAAMDDGEVLNLNIEAAIQVVDKETHKTNKIVTLIADIKGMIKEENFGDLSSGGKAETEIVIATTYYKLTIDGKEIFELDVLNMVDRKNTKEINAAIKAAIGL